MFMGVLCKRSSLVSFPVSLQEDGQVAQRLAPIEQQAPVSAVFRVLQLHKKEWMWPFTGNSLIFLSFLIMYFLGYFLPFPNWFLFKYSIYFLLFYPVTFSYILIFFQYSVNSFKKNQLKYNLSLKDRLVFPFKYSLDTERNPVLSHLYEETEKVKFIADLYYQSWAWRGREGETLANKLF